LYRREGPGKWTRFEALQEADKESSDFSFESIDGFSEKDVYIVGWEGEIWHFDGSTLQRLGSPTDRALYRVRCATDGVAYACGQTGTLLRAEGGEWTALESGTTEDLWDLAFFDGQLYATSLSRFYRLDGNRLEVLMEGDFHRLSESDGLLWSIGKRQVLELDNGTLNPVY
jgi:hypothetical protein